MPVMGTRIVEGSVVKVVVVVVADVGVGVISPARNHVQVM